ncbi:MAG: antitoxin [Actinomycetota bacterium]
MRTTVTLDPDTAQLIRRRMRERNQSFKHALNDAIRASVGGSAAAEPFRTEPASLGNSAVNLDRALRLAADIEDDDLVRKMRAGS